MSAFVYTETGEITEPRTALAPLDKSAASVVTVLENAKTWLSTAVEMTGPEEIAAAKAHIRTAETYARELHLSKDIQQDAQEMVRRAEYALGKSIRKGQEEGTVRKTGDRQIRYDQTGLPRGDVDRSRLVRNSSVADLGPDQLLPNGQERNDIYTIADAVEPEQFEAALDEAKAEGNLSRANVVRKVKQQQAPDQSRAAKADVIEELAAQGYTSRQMTKRVGVADATVRDIAREFGIDIPADRVVGRTRRIDHTQAVESAVTELDNLVSSLSFIDFAEVDPSEAGEWATSLTDSITELRRFAKQIKEMTHV